MHQRIALAALLALSACAEGSGNSGPSTSAVKYGEPVGITLAGAPGLPSGIEIRVAVTAGRDTDPLVKPIAAAALAGLGGCPAFVEGLRAGATPSLSFHVEGGRIASGTSDDEPARCVAGKMVGAELGDAAMPPLDALVGFLIEPSRDGK